MLFQALIVAGFIGSQADEGQDRQGRAILALFQDNITRIEDVQFVFEGTSRLHNSSSPDVERGVRNFSGIYAYRPSDAAIALDVYEDAPNLDMPQTRQTYALVNWRMETATHIADSDKRPPGVRQGPGTPATLNRPQSPQQYLLLWPLGEAARDPVKWGFRVVGSETIDGVPYTIAEMSQSPGNPPIYRMWLDLEAGALARRVELRKHGMIIQRIKINLKKYSLTGEKSVWFPIRGEIDTFSLEKGEIVGGPFIREENYVVAGSLTFNRNLTDRDFSIRPESRIFSASGGVKGAREFKEAQRKAPRDTERTDAESVRRRLSEGLAEAEAQSKELEASSEAEAQSESGSIRLVLALLGCAGIIAAVALKRTRR